MTPKTIATAAVGAVQRQWWIVVVAMLAAAVSGYALAYDQQTTYAARATLRVDSSILARVSGLPGPERLIKAIGAESFRGALASQTKVPADEIKTSLKAYTVGSPADTFVLQYTGTDSEQAKLVASAAAASTMKAVTELGATELDRQAAVIADTEALLATLESIIVETDWERADLAFRTWQARRELADARALQATYDRAYVLEQDVSVTASSAAGKRLNDAVGAAVIGLVAGLLLALVRERLRLRGARG